MGRRRSHSCERTPDLFETMPAREVYPVRRPKEAARPMDFDARVARALSRACRECDLEREDIAARMAVILDRPSFSRHMLDGYTSEANAPVRAIPLKALKAFVRVTGAVWIWDLIVEDDGCIVMEGEEARMAQRGYVRQQIEELKRLERALAKEPPVRVRRPWR